MKLCPREHEAQLAAGEGVVDDFEIVDADLGFARGVAGMEVRIPVVVEEHRDHDSEEAADRRHAAIMRLRPDGTSIELPVGGAGKTRKSVAELVATLRATA